MRPTTLFLAAALAAGAAGPLAADDVMEPYPPAEAGTVRTAFEVPAMDDEETRRVEIVVGKDLHAVELAFDMHGQLIREDDVVLEQDSTFEEEEQGKEKKGLRARFKKVGAE